MKRIVTIILVALVIALTLLLSRCPKEVNVQPFITILSPNGGEQWETGETHLIEWTSAGYSPNTPIQIGLRNTKYDPNIDKGEITIANTTNTGNYSWTIPSTIEAGSFFKIIIYIDGGGPNPEKFDLSDNNFQITQAPSIILLYPNSGEKLTQGQSYLITWRTDLNEEVAINLIDYTPGNRYGMQYGVTNGMDIRAKPGEISFLWTIPASIQPGDYYKISIGRGEVNDFSDEYFSIVLAR